MESSSAITLSPAFSGVTVYNIHFYMSVVTFLQHCFNVCRITHSMTIALFIDQSASHWTVFCFQKKKAFNIFAAQYLCLSLIVFLGKVPEVELLVKWRAFLKSLMHLLRLSSRTLIPVLYERAYVPKFLQTLHALLFPQVLTIR